MDALLLPGVQAFLRYHHLPGAMPALVWLHGLGGAASSFLPAATHERLAGRRSLLVDLLGFGCSDRPASFGYRLEDHAAAVAALLDRLELRDSVLVGHSLGGSVAVVLASMRSDLVGRVILVEAVLEQGPDSASRAFAAQSEAEFTARGYAAFVESVRRDALAGDAGAVELLGTLAAAAPFAVHRSAAGLTASAGPALRDRLLALAAPRTYLWGERSLERPGARDGVRVLAAGGVEVGSVPSSEHHVHVENPAGLAEALADAIAAR